jgi:hypothetical protein
MEAWLQSHGLQGNTIAKILEICETEFIESPDVLRQLHKKDELKDVFKQHGLRISLENALQAGTGEGKTEEECESSIDTLLGRLEPKRQQHERDAWKKSLAAEGIRDPEDLKKMGPEAIAADTHLPLYLRNVLAAHVNLERSAKCALLPKQLRHLVLACQLNVYYISNVDVINQTFDIDMAIEAQLSKNQAKTPPFPSVPDQAIQRRWLDMVEHASSENTERKDGVRIVKANTGVTAFIPDGHLMKLWIRGNQCFRAQSAKPTDQNYKATFDEIMDTPELWDPHLDILNKKRVEKWESWATKNAKRNAVYFKIRLQATLFSQFSLSSFPFDQQALRIQLYSSRHTLHDDHGNLGLLLIPRPQSSHLLRKSTDMLESWDINSDIVHAIVGATPSVHSLSRDRHPMIEYLIFVNRKPWHYILNIAVPMFTLATLGLTVYLDPRGDVISRIEVMVTLILSCITYQIVISKMLPDIPYYTWLDRYVSMCVAMLILIVVDTVVAHNLEDAEDGDQLESTLMFDWFIPDSGSYIGIGNLVMCWMVVHAYQLFQLGMYHFVYRKNSLSWYSDHKWDHTLRAFLREKSTSIPILTRLDWLQELFPLWHTDFVMMYFREARALHLDDSSFHHESEKWKMLTIRAKKAGVIPRWKPSRGEWKSGHACAHDLQKAEKIVEAKERANSANQNSSSAPQLCYQLFRSSLLLFLRSPLLPVVQALLRPVFVLISPMLHYMLIHSACAKEPSATKVSKRSRSSMAGGKPIQERAVHRHCSNKCKLEPAFCWNEYLIQCVWNEEKPGELSDFSHSERNHVYYTPDFNHKIQPKFVQQDGDYEQRIYRNEQQSTKIAEKTEGIKKSADTFPSLREWVSWEVLEEQWGQGGEEQERAARERGSELYEELEEEEQQQHGTHTSNPMMHGASTA